MPEIVSRGTRGSELTYQIGDEQIAHNNTAITGNTTLASTHNREHLVVTSGTVTLTLPTASTLNTALDATHTAAVKFGWHVKVTNNSGNDTTIDLQTGTDTLDGVANGTFTLHDNRSIIIAFDNVSGTKGYNIIGKRGWNLLETWTTTSGTEHSNTSVPAGTTMIKFAFDRVSTSADVPLLKIGPLGGAYSTISTRVGTMHLSTNTWYDDEPELSAFWAAGSQLSGVVEMVKVSSTTYAWSGVTYNTDGASSAVINHIAGLTVIDSDIDRVQLTTQAGTSTFDNGQCSVYVYVP